MPSDLFVVRPRWIAVSRIVSERLGKVYSSSYVQEVASGVRTNHRVKPILVELKVVPASPKISARRQRIAA